MEAVSLKLLGFDTGHAQLGELLTMPTGSPVVLTPLLLEDRNGSGTALAKNFSGDTSARYDRLPDHEAPVPVD